MFISKFISNPKFSMSQNLTTALIYFWNRFFDELLFIFLVIINADILFIWRTNSSLGTDSFNTFFCASFPDFFGMTKFDIHDIFNYTPK